jgi:hypothetical protein
VKSSGVKISAGLRSSSRKLPPGILVLGSAVVVAIGKPFKCKFHYGGTETLRNDSIVSEKARKSFLLSHGYATEVPNDAQHLCG